MASAALGKAAAAFQSELEELGVEQLVGAEDVGRRAAMYVAANEIWRDQMGPLLSTRQVALLTGTTKQAVSEMARRKRLLALPSRQGPLLFPAFQFGTRGRPVDGIADVVAVLGPVVETPYTTASFLTSPQPELDGATPAEWLRARRDTAPVLTAAHRQAALLER